MNVGIGGGFRDDAGRGTTEGSRSRRLPGLQALVQLFKSFFSQKVREAASGVLQASDDVRVRYINWGDSVRASYLHHSRRWIRRAREENGHMAIIKGVDEGPNLPTVVYAHEGGLRNVQYWDGTR
jgi:hypothetical protein